MQTQLATVKEDIRKEFDSKFESIFEFFKSHSYPQSDSGTSPVRKKPDNKSSPSDRTLPIGLDASRHFMEQTYMQNWLMHRFNGLPSYPPTISHPGYPYMMPPGPTPLPQARVEDKENG